MFYQCSLFSKLTIHSDVIKLFYLNHFNILSFLCSTRVSNELGAGHPKTARLAVCVVLFMAITEGILVGVVLVLIRNILGYAYSNEIEVVKYVARMLPLLATSNLIDGLQCVLSGKLLILHSSYIVTSHGR